MTRPTRVHDVLNPRLAGERPSWVSDAGRWLTQEQHDGIDEACAAVHAAWRAEVAVVLLDSLPEDVQPTGFAAALLNYWGVGDHRLHTGLLVLLLMRQRRLEMRTGYGATRVLAPNVLEAIQADNMVPHLRAGSPGAALREGVYGVLACYEKGAPKHWRWTGGARADDMDVNKHGFGGGQTPIDEFMPQRGPHGRPGQAPAGSGPERGAPSR